MELRVLPTNNFFESLVQLIFSRDEKWAPDAACFPIVVLSELPSLDAWTIGGNPLSGLALEHKLSAFYIALLKAYKLLIFVPECNSEDVAAVANSASAESLRAKLSPSGVASFNRQYTEQEPAAIAVGVAQMTRDIETACAIFRSLLPREHAYCAVQADASDTAVESAAMLQLLSYVFLVGTIPPSEIAKHIQRLATEPEVQGLQRPAVELARRLLKKPTYERLDDLNLLVGPAGPRAIRSDVDTQRAEGFDANMRDEAFQREIYKRTWEAFAVLRTYRLCRDFARWLKKGAFKWAREWHKPRSNRPEATQGQENPRFRLLIIDPLLARPSKSGDRLRLRLTMILNALFTKAGSELILDVIVDERAIFPSSSEGDGSTRGDFDHFVSRNLRSRVKRVTLDERFVPCSQLLSDPYPWEFGELPSRESHWQLFDYDAILCEVEFGDRYGGPQIVQTLTSYFQRLRQTGQEFLKQQTPAVLVLTRSSNFGYIHQCFNLGAHSFIPKDRLFQLPFRLQAAVRNEERIWRDLRGEPTASYVDNMGHRSNFRSLYSLLPTRTGQLRRSDRPFVVSGNGDAMDRDWLRSLPKSDLHTHLGTAICLSTIRSLAFNSIGHFVLSHSDATVRQSRDEAGISRGHVSEAIRQAIQIVILAGIFQLYEETKLGPRALCPISREPERSRPAEILNAAAIWVIGQDERADRERKGRALDFRELYKARRSPLEEVVGLLAPVKSPVTLHHAAALIVCATAVMDRRVRPQELFSEIIKPWHYLNGLHQWRVSGEEDIGFWENAVIQPTVNLCIALARATGSGQSSISANTQDYFRELHDAVSHRVKKASEFMAETISAAKGQLAETIRGSGECSEMLLSLANYVIRQSHREPANAPCESPESAIDRIIEFVVSQPPESRLVPSIEDLIINPQPKEGEELWHLGLLPYLWGCGLLGAEHLQYPENLLLAASDITEQLLEDNVMYCELRCETPGYTRAGMSAAAATDLLQHGLDLANIYRWKNPQRRSRIPMVRINVLLAAKRHKLPEDCAAVISLLERYVSYGPRELPDCGSLSTPLPPWWKPCSVVGFDLSGNESNTSIDLDRHIQRLFQYNSPITIHAGEAATAKSVWTAVYNLHARRIGHGLRLRENTRLLRYCIDEGICMEMCPTSNLLTHGFLPIKKASQYDGLKIEHYPLRFYMAAGLEVCINTDNRWLHQNRTLTDEYIMAARLSGGFSRWEILKLVRAGFKHAFLPKAELSSVLSAAEDYMYPIVAHPPGLDWTVPV